MKPSFFRYLSLITQLGLVIIVAMVIGLSAGIFLDKRLNSGFLFTVIFSIFGVIGGFRAAYQLINKIDQK